MTSFYDKQLRDVTIIVSSTDEPDDGGEPFAIAVMYRLEIEVTQPELGHFIRKVGDLTEVVHGPELIKPVV